MESRSKYTSLASLNPSAEYCAAARFRSKPKLLYANFFRHNWIEFSIMVWLRMQCNQNREPKIQTNVIKQDQVLASCSPAVNVELELKIYFIQSESGIHWKCYEIWSMYEYDWNLYVLELTAICKFYFWCSCENNKLFESRYKGNIFAS